MEEKIKTVPFVCKIPTTAIELTVTAKVPYMGEVHEYTSKLNIEGIRNGFMAGKEWDYFRDKAKKELGIE